MNYYICVIPKVASGETLVISPRNWEAFRRKTEERHQVSMVVHDSDTAPLTVDRRCWILEVKPRSSATGLSLETAQQISREIDAFIEPRRTPLPQAA